MRCTNKFKANGFAGISVVFHSADYRSMAIYVMKPEEAEKFELGKFYEFNANEQTDASK